MWTGRRILTGEIWLSHEDTGKDIYKKAGEIQIDSFLNRIENKIEVDHHDMGFCIRRPAWRAIN